MRKGQERDGGCEEERVDMVAVITREEEDSRN